MNGVYICIGRLNMAGLVGINVLYISPPLLSLIGKFEKHARVRGGENYQPRDSTYHQ